MARPRAPLTLNDLAATRTPPALAPAKGAQGVAGKGKRAAGGEDRTRRGQTLRLEPEAWRQLKMLAIKQGTTSHDRLIQLFDHYNRPTIAG